MTTSHTSPFAHISLAPADPILGVTEAFARDPHPRKVNLGVGVYQNAEGKMPVMATIKEAEQRLLVSEATKSYLPIDGFKPFIQAAQGLLFGPNAPILADQRVATVQTLGGTGALRVGADLLRKTFPESDVWISSPSWENHRALFETAGFDVHEYPYYDPTTRDVDFEGMKRCLEDMPATSVVVLHVCCHNPTGVDLSVEQWKAVRDIVKARQLIPFLDFAYQGFGTGLNEDAFSVRLFAESDVPMLVAHSFSKNFGLYRERVGTLSVAASNSDEATRITSQLKKVIRTNYSNPPSHGAQVVSEILNAPELRVAWEQEVAEMRGRILSMREQFVAGLLKHGVTDGFGFVTRQRGMFSYSGLPVDVVKQVRNESVYILESGRICLAALNEQNLDYVCEAIAKALPG
jgi:aromatic-amino-acid transaminase